jgi:hypothetical protein
VPVFAGRLKQIMLGLNSSFNEANYGFQQFRAFLEAHQDLVSIEEQGLQLYVSLHKPGPAAMPVSVSNGEVRLPVPPSIKPAADLSQRYRSFLREVTLRVVDPGTRQQVLADLVATLQAHSELSLNEAADLLKDRYDAENALTQKIAVPDVMRLLIMSSALAFAGQHASSNAPVQQAAGLTLESLVPACDMVYLWRLVEGGVPLYAEQLSPVLYGADSDPARVACLCQALVDRQMIVPNGESFMVSPVQVNSLLQREALQMAVVSLTRVMLPPGEPITPITAENLFREASDLRQKDFAGSAQRYLQAARIQLEALKAGQPRTGFDDLKWYLASYCSVRAGHAFVNGNYTEAVPHYLAFFGLAQESDSVWPRIQRLVNPMSSYYFAIAGKELDEIVPPNLGRSPACQVAWRIHNHANPQVIATWEDLIRCLAQVNLGIVRQTLRDLSGLIGPMTQVGSEQIARIERTRAFLGELIAEREHIQDRTI